ncbi:MAG: hypothetical protein I3273_04775 [Candidatus Moeniiplasma glomeromycotorum]|nr:hypothetical protein [Candidatus Moeniiplasma glomeromycotorum]MCE8168327.1 hypothetical protein [Candidatus Moeniiplasma glomeromycotorum]MCE8169405.1 hypothetical protein [Candidatus Moeniiplasma glomeromycotorum]
MSYDRNRGHFFYLFGKFQLIEKMESSKIYVDWNKLLLILFLLYFPLKIIIHLVLNYWRRNYQREVNIYLTKKLLNYAAKNKDLLLKNPAEKVYIINNVVPEFSRQFIGIPINFFEIFVDISFTTFNLYNLVNSSHLSDLVPLLIIFILVNLIWFASFYYFFDVSRQANLAKKSKYQELEKAQVKIYLESLPFDSKPKNLKNLPKLIDNNSRKITQINFLSVLYQLPDIIIPGISILFLFLYYQFYCGGKEGLSWSAYFIANNLRTILRKAKQGFNLLSAISAGQENYQKIESFLTAI